MWVCGVWVFLLFWCLLLFKERDVALVSPCAVSNSPVRLSVALSNRVVVVYVGPGSTEG